MTQHRPPRPSEASGEASRPAVLRPRAEGRSSPRRLPGRLGSLVPARTTAARTPFVLLVVALLAGGMLGLLFLNASLNEGSFELSELQRETQELTDEEQELRAEVDAYAAPDALAQRARELGMVPGGPPAFLNADGRVLGDPTPAVSPSARESEAQSDPGSDLEGGSEDASASRPARADAEEGP